MPTPGFLPSVPTLDGLPPQPVRLVVLGLGVGGGRRRRAPLMILRYSMRFRHTIQTNGRVSSALLTPLDDPGARLCLPYTPLPLSPYNRTCPSTLPTNGRGFLWSPRSPSPRRSSWPGLPDGLLNASRSPFRVPPPPIPWLCFYLGLVAPYMHLAVISGSWVNPRYKRGPQGQVTALANRGTEI